MNALRNLLLVTTLLTAALSHGQNVNPNPFQNCEIDGPQYTHAEQQLFLRGSDFAPDILAGKVFRFRIDLDLAPGKKILLLPPTKDHISYLNGGAQVIDGASRFFFREKNSHTSSLRIPADTRFVIDKILELKSETKTSIYILQVTPVAPQDGVPQLKAIRVDYMEPTDAAGIWHAMNFIAGPVPTENPKGNYNFLDSGKLPR